MSWRKRWQAVFVSSELISLRVARATPPSVPSQLLDSVPWLAAQQRTVLSLSPLRTTVDCLQNSRLGIVLCARINTFAKCLACITHKRRHIWTSLYGLLYFITSKPEIMTTWGTFIQLKHRTVSAQWSLGHGTSFLVPTAHFVCLCKLCWLVVV